MVRVVFSGILLLASVTARISQNLNQALQRTFASTTSLTLSRRCSKLESSWTLWFAQFCFTFQGASFRRHGECHRPIATAVSSLTHVGVNTPSSLTRLHHLEINSSTNESLRGALTLKCEGCSLSTDHFLQFEQKYRDDAFEIVNALALRYSHFYN